MKQNRLWTLLFTFIISIAITGCSDEIDKAIGMLGGSKDKQEEAMGIINISAKDPMPKLLKAIKNKKLSPIARENVAFLIGVQNEKMDDDSSIPILMEALKDSEDKVAIAILGALEKTPGEKSVKALQTARESKNKVVAREAADILDARAADREAEADKLSGAAALPKQIELLEEAVAINPSNKQRIEKLAGLYIMNGQQDKADALFTAGGSFATAVKVVGPFPNDGQDYVEPDKIDFNSTVTSPTGEELMWTDFTDIPENGIIDFRKNPSLRIPNSAFYAALKINMKKADKGLIKIYGKEETVSLWLNGKSIAADKSLEDQEAKFEAPFKNGENQALIKISSRKYPRFSIRVSTMDDKKFKTLSFGL